jgi:redox-sensing transcriptional repressor
MMSLLIPLLLLLNIPAKKTLDTTPNSVIFLWCEIFHTIIGDNKYMKLKISAPAIERLSILYSILEDFEKSKKTLVSSAELGRLMNIQPHTIRKDINFLGQAGGEAGYNVSILKNIIKQSLGFDVPRNACIVGLGRLGSAIMNFSGFLGSNIKIAAGFDSSINRIETFVCDIPLFPAYEIPEIVKSKNIELGVIAVPPTSAQMTADRLIDGGVKGIINFAPVTIKVNTPEIVVRNFYVLEEFRILSALISK